jgi:hypothetical protein
MKCKGERSWDQTKWNMITPLLTVEKRKRALQFENRLAGPRPKPQPATIQTQLNNSMLIHEYCYTDRILQATISIGTEAADVGCFCSLLLHRTPLRTSCGWQHRNTSLVSQYAPFHSVSIALSMPSNNGFETSSHSRTVLRLRE